MLELLDRMGQDVRSDLSVLENDVAELVRDKVTRAIAVERKRIASERKIEAEKKEKEPAVAAEAVAAAPDKPEPAVESPAASLGRDAEEVVSPPLAQRPQAPAEGARGVGGAFASPFEDELDVPAFLRKRQDDDEEEDRETPTFFRRAQD